jgi:SsrA-binding protein
MAKKGAPDGRKIVAQNRRARHDYTIEQTVEAGLVLTGTEVKSLRAGRATIAEAFARVSDGEFYLFNAHIPEYDPAGRFNHEPNRPRKLLLSRREMGRLIGAVQRQGLTLVPLSIYFSERGIAKAELALGRGRAKADKRDALRAKDWQRQKARVLRDRG